MDVNLFASRSFFCYDAFCLINYIKTILVLFNPTILIIDMCAKYVSKARRRVDQGKNNGRQPVCTSTTLFAPAAHQVFQMVHILLQFRCAYICKIGDLGTLLVSYSMFLAFVICVTFVAFNVLVGLTVEDIRNFQDNAYIRKLSMRIEFIRQMEQVQQKGEETSGHNDTQCSFSYFILFVVNHPHVALREQITTNLKKNSFCGLQSPSST